MRIISLCTILFFHLAGFAQPNAHKGYFKRYIHPKKSNFSTQVGLGFVGINGTRYTLDEPENQNYFLNPHLSLGVGYQLTHYVGFLMRAGYFHYRGGAIPGTPGGIKGNAMEGYLALKHYLLPIEDFDGMMNLTDFNIYGLVGVGTIKPNPRDANSGERLSTRSESADWAMQLPLGLGVEYEYRDHFLLGVEVNYHLTNTNSIDTAVNSERRKQDNFGSIGINLAYRPGKRNFNYRRYLKSITRSSF